MGLKPVCFPSSSTAWSITGHRHCCWRAKLTKLSWPGSSCTTTSNRRIAIPVQSRWVDASVLPSRCLNANEVQLAAQEEVVTFQQIFGTIPRVAVPPTFIWNEDVEKAWAAAGITVVITPGNRFESRDVSGRPVGKGRAIHNGQSSENNIIYLVRDDYFEPSLGHTALQALGQLSAKTRLGRPTLYETHRFNFLGSEEEKNAGTGRTRTPVANGGKAISGSSISLQCEAGNDSEKSRSGMAGAVVPTQDTYLDITT